MRRSPARVTVRRLMLAAGLIGLVAATALPWAVPLLMILPSAFETAPRLSEPELERAVEELRRRDFPPGMHVDVALPPPLRPMTKMGTVDLFKTTDGRTIVLFKTSVGWKGNYRGIVYSDAPLKPEEVMTNPRDQPSILIDHFQTFIRKRINRRHYEVFSDLG